MIKFYCQHCEQKLSATKEIFGTNIQCPSCSNLILVPEDPEALSSEQIEPKATANEDLAISEEIENNKQEVVAELELAWPLKKVGVAIDKPEAIAATKQGWKVYSMHHALNQIEQLASSLR